MYILFNYKDSDIRQSSQNYRHVKYAKAKLEILSMSMSVGS